MHKKSVAAASVTTLLLALPAGAWAIPASGPHETVDVTTSTKQPNISAGFGYAASYHAAGNPDADPPALRHLVIQLPPGTRIDTSVPGQCTASDVEIKLVGPSACPASSRVGTGQVTAKALGLGTQTYDSILYNAPGQQLELVMSGGRVIGIAHTYVHGTTLDGPVPTCISGGDPPSGCPFDQVTLLANHLYADPISVIRGGRRYNYGTTPPACPSSRQWGVSVTFTYADGSVDKVPLHVPCHRRATRKRSSTRRHPDRRQPTKRTTSS